MLQGAKLKVRDIREMQCSNVVAPKNTLSPLKKRKSFRSAKTTKNFKEENRDNETVSVSNIAATTTKTTRKRITKSYVEQTPFNQKRIDSYFTSCPKTYDIKLSKEELSKLQTQKIKTNRTKGIRNNRSTNPKNKKSPGRPKARRKRLFSDTTEPSTTNMSDTSSMKVRKNKNNIECITIDSDSEDEKEEISNLNEKSTEHKNAPEAVSNAEGDRSESAVSANGEKIASINSSPIAASSLSFGLQLTKTSCEISKSIEASTSTSSSGRRKTKPCPPYKIIEDTTFAVDAFQFGYIHNVTHYFLTHFHADHYIGLTKSFSMPLFVSPITARLLRAFIPIQEEYIHELELNESVVINNIEITALDANHCPGSVMFVFKFLDSGKCILHTGDFRASHTMESEPIFWNNSIHTIYLDTTYISDKYAFCTQYESIEKALDLIDKLPAKYAWCRVLYICGSYLIGKERFWSALAEQLNLKVWTERNRSKALKAINDERLNRLLVEDPNEANMHILPMGKITYLELVEYFKQYEHKYDILFALRPSGWEKDTKPRYSSKINLVGVEYSEHSSYAEMQRFVKFIKPEHVISTVPRGRNSMRTSGVPQNWYKYDKLKASNNYQPTIDSFLGGVRAQKKPTIRLPNANKGGVEQFASPLKTFIPKENNEFNNIAHADIALSLVSSQPAAINNENVKEVCSENFPTNAQNHENLVKNKIITLAKSVSNSSEEFEKSDFVAKTKNYQSNKKDGKKKVLTKTKQKRNQKQLSPEKIIINNHKIKSEAQLPTADTKIRRRAKSQLENNQLHNSSTKESNDFKNNSSSKRVTRSQNNLNRLKSQYAGESSESTSQKNSKTISSDSMSGDKAAPAKSELPISQKRMTRSKTASTTKTSASLNALKDEEREFEMKLFKISTQNNIPSIAKPKSLLKTVIHLQKSQENPILISSTNSSMDRLSHDGDACNFNKINSSTISANFLDDFERLPTKPSNNKRHALNSNLTPFKKIKPTFRTQTIFNTILEQTENFDRFNCSQLAGLVVEAVNQQHPDNSKDHIPADLLSDADDDWM